MTQLHFDKDGFFLPEVLVPGFEPMGHRTSMLDVEALRMLVRYVTGGSMGPVGVVEVGSFVGGTAIAMQNEMAIVDTLYCVDTWAGSSETDIINKIYAKTDVFETFKSNIGLANKTPGRPQIRGIRKTSLKAAALFSDQSLDMVFLDADHTKESVLADIKAWNPKVKDGGILCGHDLGAMFPGVAEAIDSIGGCHGVIGTVWFFFVNRSAA